jgi:hypothetical protein
MVAAPVATAADGPSPSPTVGDGYGASTAPSVGALTQGPVCDGNVPYLSYDVDVSDDPSATSFDVTWTSLDGTHSQTEKNIPGTVSGGHFTGRILWLGAAESGGQATGWPGWVFKNGTWEEGGQYTWVRPTVRVTYTVHDGTASGASATGAAVHAAISDGVYRSGTASVDASALVVPAASTVTDTASYPPATQACANPMTVVRTPSGSSSVSPSSPGSVTPLGGSSTAAGGTSDNGKSLAETGMDVLPFAGGAVALLLVGGALVLVGRRHRKLTQD